MRKVLEEYLETGTVSDSTIRRSVRPEEAFSLLFRAPPFNVQGVEELLDGLERYTQTPQYGEEFGAKVYKIARDDQGNRLTYLKITGGTLRVKEVLPDVEEKVNQIRIYSGAKYELVPSVRAGQVCAVTGPEDTCPGQGLGAEQASDMPVLEPVLTYRIVLPEGLRCPCHAQKFKTAGRRRTGTPHRMG